MKNSLRKLTLPVIAVLTLALTACGASDGGTDNKNASSSDSASSNVNAEDLVKKSTEANNKVKSSRIDFVAKLSMAIGGQQQSTNIDAKIDSFKDPLKTKMTLTADGQSAEMYLDKDYLYVNSNGTWVKTAPENDTTSQQADPNAYISFAKDLKVDGEEQISGVDSYKITGSIPSESITEAFKNNTALTQMTQQAGMSDTSELFKDAADVPITIWVAKDNSVTMQYEIDMTALMQTILDNTVKSLGLTGADADAKVDLYTLKMTVSEVDKLADFEIPQEALDAVAVGAGGVAEADSSTEAAQ